MKSSVSYVSLLKNSFSAWQKDNATVWCAALAYFTVFSIGPLLLLLISIIGFISANTSFEQNITTQLQGFLGRDGANMLHTVVSHTKKPSSSILGTIIGAITLLLGAMGIFGQLQQMLNHICGVTQKPKSGIIPFLRSRLLNFSMIGVVAFLLLVSLVVTTVISGLGAYLNRILPFSPLLLEGVNFVLSFVIISVLFATIMKVLPDVQISWHNTWIGAAITSLLFTIGKAVIGIYIGHSGIASEYGAAGSLVILLLWVYYSSQILFFGTELTKEYTLARGGKIIPNQFAILTTDSLKTTQPPKDDIHSRSQRVTKELAKEFSKGVVTQVEKHKKKKKSHSRHTK